MSVNTEGKSLVELLDMLAPAPVPDPIPMTPQTAGWVILLVVLTVLLASVWYVLHKRRKANEYRRIALAELKNGGDDPAKSAEILRRAALAAFPRRKVAGLHGNDWLNFLRQSSENMSFSDGTAGKLLIAPYQGGQADPEVTKLARDWIKSHKAEKRP